MSTATLPGTELDTDIENLVEGAFKEIDCCSQRKAQIPCEGEIAGYQEFHDCIQGWLCLAHWKNAMEIYPVWRKHLEETRRIHCAHCLCLFTTIESYVRLIPL
jgi:hypothetical protein